MSYNVTDQHIKKAEAFVEKSIGPDGLAKVDLGRFWEEQQEARKNMWSTDGAHVPLGIWMGTGCAFAELGEEEDTYRLTHDSDYALDLAKRYNDIAEKIVGRRFAGENKPDPTRKWPEIKALHDIFEAKNVWHEHSYWLQQSANTPDELSALLDRVEERLTDLRTFMLPDNWESEKARLTGLGCKVPRYRSQRGPITFAMSVYGVENLIYLIYDNVDLATRFRDTIIRAMLERARVLDEEGGFSPEDAPRGFSFADDNCAMLTADMYEFFGYPIIKACFDRYAPDEGDRRGQHSDSEMAHLLPILGKLNFGSVNFGPRLTAAEIREHCPNAVIVGQLAPFTFMRNEQVNIVAELIRDIDMTREKRGLNFTTAGSINNGSSLASLRLIMAAIQEFGWLD